MKGEQCISCNNCAVYLIGPLLSVVVLIVIVIIIILIIIKKERMICSDEGLTLETSAL